MKIVSDIYDNIRKVDYYKKQFEFDQDKKNILFVDPIMSSFDFYSMIVPFLCLEQTGKYKSALTGMYRFSEMDKIQTEITESEIRWADVIVIPMSLESFNNQGELFDQLRSIKPQLKIVMTVEFDFYEITNEHYFLDEIEIKNYLDKLGKTPNKKNIANARKDMKQRIIERLENNLRGADRLAVMNANLQKKLLSKDFKDVKYIPVLIEENSFKENIDFMDTLGVKGTEGIVFVSVDLSVSTAHAFKTFIPIFEKLRKKHKEKFRLVVIGDKPTKYFKQFDLEVDHLSRHSIVGQFKSIVKSTADIHLILNKKNLYSTNSESIFSFVERGLFGVPIVALDQSPWNEVIKHEQTGFLLKKREEFEILVNDLMKDKTKLIDMSNALKNVIISNCQITDELINGLGSIFFDQYKIEVDESND
jgi:glycosyltransferase involved in cell wall biosynthesis